MNSSSSLSFGQAALISLRTNDEMYFTLIRTVFFLHLCRYLAGDALDSDSDDNDDDDDDDQPDKFEGACDDEKEESHQSKIINWTRCWPNFEHVFDHCSKINAIKLRQSSGTPTKSL